MKISLNNIYYYKVNILKDIHLNFCYSSSTPEIEIVINNYELYGVIGRCNIKTAQTHSSILFYRKLLS